MGTAPGGGSSTRARPLSSGRLLVRLLRPLSAVVLMGTLASLDGAPTVAAAPAPGPRWPAHVDWEPYVTAPASPVVRAVRVVSTSGDVTGARTLTHARGGRATLRMRKGGRPPVIVLDYGKDVGGTPIFDVRSQTGIPLLRAAYSEGLQYLGPDGDDTPSASPAGDPARADNLVVGATGLLSSGYIQGAERYERISLTTPGRVTLASVGIDFSAERAKVAAYRGWFASSSTELNRIWYAGAYTVQLDELPARSVAPSWRVIGGALDAVGGNVGLLARGTRWSDYSLSFETRVVDDNADWIVRATSPSSGYLFVLHDDSGSGRGGASLAEVAFGPDEFAVIDDVTLPTGVNVAHWTAVTTVVAGTRITTSIDGRPVSAFTTDSLPHGASVYNRGTVGFAALGSTAEFRDVHVVAPYGTTLYADALARPQALAAFPGPDVTVPDAVPVIMDGAKRDRVVWSGDLGVEIPTLFYTTASSAYARGSLALLASYQVADGESGTNVNPTVPLGSFPQSGSTYSASYSMDEVDNIATYYLYTGDLAFVRSEWPMITRELAYDASMVDDRGLLSTNESDGQDWDYYDGNKIGEVTAYNDIYYRVLTNAASLAAALGLQGPAATYAQAAARLRSAINSALVDPATGLYVMSNRMPAAVAQDGNALAVLFGIAPAQRDASVLGALTRTLPSTPYGPMPFTGNTLYQPGVSPFTTADEVDALFAAGDTRRALSLIDTVWGHMDAPGPDYTGADWEWIGTDGSPGFGEETSLAHGWSSGATAALSAYVLGVQPASAGFATWTVRPHPGSLAWLEGDVPTPHGPIAVRWAQARSSGRFALAVTGPPATAGTVSVPVPGTGATVTVRAAVSGHPLGAPRVTEVAGGHRALAFTAKGGVTYDVDVLPR
jgi:alpha-L-rhamnosidase